MFCINLNICERLSFPKFIWKYMNNNNKILKNTVQKHKSSLVKIVSTWTLDSREPLLSDSCLSRVTLLLPGWNSHKNIIGMMSAHWLLKLHFLSDVFHYHIDWSMKTGHLVLPWKDTALSAEGLLFLSPLLMDRQTTPTPLNSGQHCLLLWEYPWMITERFTLLSGLEPLIELRVCTTVKVY